MGDDACWLHMVCLECGRVIEGAKVENQGDETCPHCGAELYPPPVSR